MVITIKNIKEGLKISLDQLFLDTIRKINNYKIKFKTK